MVCVQNTGSDIRFMNTNGALKAYKQVGVQSEVTLANPHRLVQMLLDGALDRIAVAKGHMARGEVAEKGSTISKTIAIVDGLRMSLDGESGGTIANNLDELYEYMGRRLLQANAEDNPALLDEVAALLGEIKSAWDAIPEAAMNVQTKVVNGTVAQVPAIG